MGSKSMHTPDPKLAHNALITTPRSNFRQPFDAGGDLQHQLFGSWGGSTRVFGQVNHPGPCPTLIA